MPPEHEVLYEDMDDTALAVLCTIRKIRHYGRKVDLVNLLVAADRDAFLEQKESFGKDNDPTGVKHEAFIKLRTKLEKQWMRSITMSEIEKEERIINDAKNRIERRGLDLDIAIRKFEEEEAEDLKINTKRVKGYEKQKKKAAEAQRLKDQQNEVASSIPEQSETAPISGSASTPISIDSDGEATPREKARAGKNGVKSRSPHPGPNSTTAEATDNASVKTKAPTSALKRSADAVSSDNVHTPRKSRHEEPVPATATTVDIVEPGNIGEEMIKDNQTFLRISGPSRITVDLLKMYKKDAAEYNPIAVRADEYYVYIVFQRDAPESFDLDKRSSRQKCVSHLSAVIQSGSNNQTRDFRKIEEMSSYVRGEHYKHEHAFRAFETAPEWQEGPRQRFG
ncbi:hypothetical protein VTL71DRAFT_5088 [Oculimacula yallundae]|uniref:Uncharacterized protein n=1 Tax=Oculimacula yallundae TaxID=86028 RepID=A0ABR4C054_9HELO